MGCNCSQLIQRLRQWQNQTQEAITTTSDTSPPIRIIHIDGHVEDLVTNDHRILTVSDVISSLSSSAAAYVLCSSEQLRSSGSSLPLPVDHVLQSNDLYLLLPQSIFKADNFSSLDLAALANRLTSLSSDAATPVNIRHVGASNDKDGKAWRPVLDSIEEMSSSSVGGSSRI